MFGNESSPLISVMGTKVPRNESSTYMELSILGTKVPWYESSSYP